MARRTATSPQQPRIRRIISVQESTALMRRAMCSVCQAEVGALSIQLLDAIEQLRQYTPAQTLTLKEAIQDLDRYLHLARANERAIRSLLDDNAQLTELVKRAYVRGLVRLDEVPAASRPTLERAHAPKPKTTTDPRHGR